MAMGAQEQLVETIKPRIKRLNPLLIVIFFLFVIRLWDLQILKGAHYKQRSEIYRLRHERIVGNRGLIFDRFGTVIVENRPTFHLEIIPEDCRPDIEEIGRKLGLFLPDMKEKIFEQLKSIIQSPPFKSYVILRDLPFSDIVKLEARIADFPGIRVSYGAKRYYPFGKAAAHIIGYMGKITAAEWENLQHDSRFKKYDLIGKSGVEKTCNSDLTGIPTTITFETDALGKRRDILTPVEQRTPRSGKDIKLTINWDLQLFIEDRIKEIIGAVVVMDPMNGDILALANSPSFNPNLFSMGITQEDWQQLIENPSHPLINRGIQSAYPPGSIFKIITAVTALRNGIVTPKTRQYCSGTAKFFNEYRDCWKRGGHGWLDFHNAIVNSCNIYFFHIASELDMQELAKTALEFGLGSKTGIRLPHEETGLVPTPEWKKRVLQQPWWQGETLSVSIGQGSVLATPIQLARFIAAIANGGYLYRPRLVSHVGQIEQNTEQPQKVNVSDNIIKLIQEGLRGVVNERGGTAIRVKMDDIIVAGKTGTSQVITKEITEKYGKDIPTKYKDHNWFACFAPFENPQLAISVFIEHGGKEGTTEKLEIAKDIIKYYMIHFSDDKENDILTPE